MSRGGEYYDECAGGANHVDAIVLHAYVGAGGGGVAGADGLLCGWKLEKGVFRKITLGGMVEVIRTLG